MIIELINKSLSQETDESRNYIGASSIGRPCMRALYYDFHGVPKEKISPELALTFEHGKSVEDMILSMDLLAVSFLPQMVCKDLDVFQGTPDAVIHVNGLGYILEIKTANSSSFTQAQKNGVRRWRPQYYDQVQAYMGLSGIEQSIILVFNKDNSHLYEELIKFDNLHYELLVERARQISLATEPPAKLNESPMFYVCKMCEFRRHCHG